MCTSKFLIFTGKLILKFAGFVKFGIGTLKFLLFIAKIALTLFVHGKSFFQTRLHFNINFFQVFGTFLKFSSSSIGLYYENTIFLSDLRKILIKVKYFTKNILDSKQSFSWIYIKIWLNQKNWL